MWALIEAPIPNAPEAKYISQIPSPNNLLMVADALVKSGIDIGEIKLYQLLRCREKFPIYEENIVYNLGEATCMDYLYNYAMEFLNNIVFFNHRANIWLTGYHAWLHRDKFNFCHITDPFHFEDDIIGKQTKVNYHNLWQLNDWSWMQQNVNSKSTGIRATLRASRGCPHRCRMCPVSIVHKGRVRRFPVEWVIDEIQSLHTNYNIREIGFLDDNLFFDKKWGEKLLDFIISYDSKKLHFTFEEGLDVPTALNEGLIEKLKLARFHHVKLGIESLNEATLNFIQKPYRDPSKAIIAIKLLQKYHLNPTCFICIGFPTDSEESIKRDIEILVELGVKLRVQILWAYPGINFHNKSLPIEKLKELQHDALVRTGSYSWRKE